ncbi:MAG: hypothetical protein MUC88_27105 [Planctomycetes bacterium]|jgi:hypothetical protein|nr:hypothetical protein [Planctomycetota bacterium]
MKAKTHKQALDYLHRKPAGAEPAGVDEDLPPAVWALERWKDEFPKMVVLTDEVPWRDPAAWWFDLRLDLAAGRIEYRSWCVAAGDDGGAVRALRERALVAGAQRVTIYAVRRPPAPEQIAAIERANRELQEERASHGRSGPRGPGGESQRAGSRRPGGREACDAAPAAGPGERAAGLPQERECPVPGGLPAVPGVRGGPGVVKTTLFE